ncbi:hypothetical protein [Chryseobacterium sp. BIGb0232]|uniref:hypothetical protein n=1 Tax=Chryseobacterium sp. BIGb0232 TaxID=2940598 RepID=UPI000F498609|nr:hypothetical protein [Chryseobacterium sp. BIGb0232]MCS4302813.1 hypothetical protein [Chryseobacterium sp. BIGb0232]ROS17465.1 hypothetical protein EDF65_1835 [Chryseobacterium nakagawai]
MPGKTWLLSTACLLFIHCKKENVSKPSVEQDTITQQKREVVISKPKDDSQMEKVKSFLKWYRDNEDNLYSFNTIKGGPQGENETQVNYYVDFNQAEKELTFLKSSGLFSQKFLSVYKQNYVQGEEYFKKNPTDDGPPHGFDYDYFFRTQDDYQSDLQNIEAIQFTVQQISPEQYVVKFHLKNCGMTFQYTLTKGNGDQWLIDSIENIS